MSSTGLSGDARGLAHCMARLAVGATGRGIVGQRVLAEKSGYSERKVRELLAELEAPCGAKPKRCRHASPACVQLVRRARFRPEGRGRTSDAWELLLPSDQPAQAAGYSDDQPAQAAGGSPGLTGTDCTTNRHGLHDQPAACAGDLIPDVIPDVIPGDQREGRDPWGLTPDGDAGAAVESVPLAKKRWRFAPADWHPNEKHHELARERRVDLALELAKFRDHEFDKPKSDPDRTFANWLRNARPVQATGRSDLAELKARQARLAEEEARLA